MKEKISALLDAELKGRERHRVLAELSGNFELRKAWERYHLISAALRNELEILVAPNLADRIAANIKNQPSLVIPSSQLIPHKWKNNISRNFAIAASIVVLILTLPLISTDTTNKAVPALTADTAMEKNYVRAGIGWEQRSEWEKALDTFLVEHNENTPILIMNGMMSYVRLASDNSKE
jgi:hypothetical protein